MSLRILLSIFLPNSTRAQVPHYSLCVDFFYRLHHRLRSICVILCNLGNSGVAGASN